MDVDTAIAGINDVALSGSISHDLSIFGLFMAADIVVKAVMLMLLFASVWCWAIIVAKRASLKKLNTRADRFEDAFWSGEGLDKLFQRVKKSQPDPLLKTFTAGMDEWHSAASEGLPSTESMSASLKQRAERAMNTTITREMQKLERGMTFLASVGSTAPFIGLFGTVWGVMNSFIAIAGSNNTSLAVVAPGIAEALFATALGLVAAIPAVIAYNLFSTKINGYADRLDAFTAEFMTIISKQLDAQNKRASGLSRSAQKRL